MKMRKVTVLILIVILLVSASSDAFAWFDYDMDQGLNWSQAWASCSESGYFIDVYASLLVDGVEWTESHDSGYDNAYTCTSVCYYNPAYVTNDGYRTLS